MKFSVWIFLSLIISLPGKAQTQQGRWQIGVEVNQLNYEKTTVIRTTSKVLLTPSVGYFAVKNLLVSIGLPLGISSSKDPYFRENQTRIGVSPSIRYYLGGSRLKPYLSFSYSYLFNQNTYKTSDKQYSMGDHSNIFIPSIGLAYSLTDKLAFTTSLNYLIDNSESTTLFISGPTHNLQVARPNQKSLSMGVGIQFFMRK